MKHPISIALICIVHLHMAGCATHPGNVVLETVGPAPIVPITPSSTGTLKVFTAFEPVNVTNTRFENVQRHTPYRIYSSSGTLLRVVGNQVGPFEEEPESVELPAGSYQVKAFATGYGLVTVPIIIAEHLMTKVELESPGPKGKLSGQEAVRLPDGSIVGWRAQDSLSGKP